MQASAPAAIAKRKAGTGSRPSTRARAWLARAKEIFAALQRGRIDRSLFTSNANAYFSDEAIHDFAATLRPLGSPKEFTQAGQSLRGGMTARRYKVVTPKKTLRISTFWMPDGKIEQYIVTPE